MALSMRLNTTWDRRTGSPSSCTACPGTDSKPVSLALCLRAGGFDNPLNQAGKPDGFFLERDLVADDARDIQQVIHPTHRQCPDKMLVKF